MTSIAPDLNPSIDIGPSPNSSWERRARCAALTSLVSNLLLFVSNTVVFVRFGSLAVLSTAADSFLDLVSQVIVFAAMRANFNVDKEMWPLGRARLEPVGLIVVASIMGFASFEVVWQSVARLAAADQFAPKLDAYALALIGVAIGVKSVLFFVCWSVSKYSASMKVLAEDHRNDVLSNSVALICGAISSANKDAWMADPIGAILISIYIFYRWINVGREQAMMLAGKSASPEFVKLVEETVWRQSEGMTVDVIRAYHFGHRFLVEIEVVVSPETSIVVAHDKALSLQKKIEELEEVERAHVHVDYAHRDEDEHKQTFHAKDMAVQNGAALQEHAGLHRRRHHQYEGLELVNENGGGENTASSSVAPV